MSPLVFFLPSSASTVTKLSIDSTVSERSSDSGPFAFYPKSQIHTVNTLLRKRSHHRALRVCAHPLHGTPRQMSAAFVMAKSVRPSVCHTRGHALTVQYIEICFAQYDRWAFLVSGD